MNKYRNKGLAVVGSLLLACLSGCESIDSDASATESNHSNNAKKNVLFIVVDDLGYSDIAAYNKDTFYQTPNIDKLASEGLQFTSGYAASSVCSPSRVALLTGVNPGRAGTTDFFRNTARRHIFREGKFVPASYTQVLKHEEVTIAEALKDEGYTTAFLGKWHLGQEPEHWPEHQGFEYNIGGHNAGTPPGGFFAPYDNPRLENAEDGEYLTERLTDEAIGLIDNFSKDDKPFLMFMSYYTVHIPLQAPEDTVEKYAQLVPKDSGNDFDIEEQVWPGVAEREVRVKQNHPTYAAMIEHMDKNVGRLLSALKDNGVEDDTIVIFVSDNGGLSTSEGSPTSNLPLRGGKGWLYEGGVRVPYILKVPGAAANGTTTDLPAIGHDLFPTVLDVAGLKVPASAGGSRPDGVSLKPLLDGIDESEQREFSQRPLIFHYPHYSNQGGFPGAAIRVGDWKLIERFEDGAVNLYNLSEDISESTDLAALKPNIVNELRGKLHEWYEEEDAQFLRVSPDRPEYGQPWRPDASR